MTLPVPPEPSLIKQVSYSILLEMVFPLVYFPLIDPWLVMAWSQQTILEASDPSSLDVFLQLKALAITAIC